MNGQHCKSDPILGEKIKENENAQKIEILVHEALLYELASGKNINLQYHKFEKENLHKVAYLV